MSALWMVGIGWLAALLVVGGWLSWQLLRQNGRILLRLDDLEQRLNLMEFGSDDLPNVLAIGAAALPFQLPDLTGKQRTLAEFLGQPLLLIFFHPDCGYCRKLVPQIAALTANGLPQPLIIADGNPEKIRALFADHKLNCPVLLQKEGEIAEAYQVKGTPMGYLVDADGNIASALTMGVEPLLALASNPVPHPHANGEVKLADRFSKRWLTHSKLKRDGLKAGTLAPDFRLPRLDGRCDLSLADFRGRKVLLVFSDPHCGPCQQLASQLEGIHRERSDLSLVMISRGEPSENRSKIKEHGLTFPVVLQRQWEISRRYALFATPIAYLIDEQGIIARDVAPGIESILRLANATSPVRNSAEALVAAEA